MRAGGRGGRGGERKIHVGWRERRKGEREKKKEREREREREGRIVVRMRKDDCSL